MVCPKIEFLTKSNFLKPNHVRLSGCTLFTSYTITCFIWRKFDLPCLHFSNSILYIQLLQIRLAQSNASKCNDLLDCCWKQSKMKISIKNLNVICRIYCICQILKRYKIRNKKFFQYQYLYFTHPCRLRFPANHHIRISLSFSFNFTLKFRWNNVLC